MRLGEWLSANMLRALPRTRLSRGVGDCATDSCPRSSRAQLHVPMCVYTASTWMMYHRGRMPIRASIGHELIGEPADVYAGGSYAVVYLAPRDYHRVHAPVDGEIRHVREISGDLYPVNTMGERHVPRLLVRNKRVVVFIDTHDFGRVAVVLVGAFCVGRMTVPILPAPDVPQGDHTIELPSRVRRGDEIGTFHLGSTVVVLVGADATLFHGGGPVRYGEKLLA
jgi:phosphatidylserine decarboxylase precursor